MISLSSLGIYKARLADTDEPQGSGVFIHLVTKRYFQPILQRSCIFILAPILKPTTMSPFFDQQWMQRFRAGDQIAMREFFYSEKNSAIGWVFNKYPWLPEADKEDFVADAFVEVYANRERYNEPRHACHALMTILRNNVTQHLRNRKRDNRFSKYTAYLTDEKFDPVAEDVDHLELIRNGIGKLSPGRRKILELMFFDGKETREIAEIMGINRQTVLNQRTDAINFLRSILPYCSKTRGRKIFPSWHLTHNQ
jgi:RNA polymerase sigma factor (sigma-70 family)